MSLQRPHEAILNEFAFLNEDELHFLRIFVQSEGRIRDMEGPLGLSYPTIRLRIRDLNVRLQKLREGSFVSCKTPSLSVAEILDKLSRKEISFQESLELIERCKKE